MSLPQNVRAGFPMTFLTLIPYEPPQSKANMPTTSTSQHRGSTASVDSVCTVASDDSTFLALAPVSSRTSSMSSSAAQHQNQVVHRPNISAEDGEVAVEFVDEAVYPLRQQ